MSVGIAFYLGWNEAHLLLTEEARSRGYGWVTCFAVTLPQAGLQEVAEDLGIAGVHGGHLEMTLWLEAARTGTLERCARDLLVRDLCFNLPRDEDNKYIDSRFHNACYSWKCKLPINYQFKEEAIRSDLIQRNPPREWLPQNDRDPILMEIFERHWPRDTPRRRYRMTSDNAGHITIDEPGGVPSGDTLILYPRPLLGCDDLRIRSQVPGAERREPSV